MYIVTKQLGMRLAGQDAGELSFFNPMMEPAKGQGRGKYQRTFALVIRV